jgi:hypothetical protein
MLAILAIALMSLAGGCTKAEVFIPKAAQLESPPLMITADQLYQEYMADEAVADTKYKGKKVRVTEVKVDTYLESESSCYLVIRWYPEEYYEYNDGVLVFYLPAFSACTLKLEPQFSEDFKDVDGGYIVEIEGECQGISDGVITVKLNWVNKIGNYLPPQGIRVW